MTFSKAMRFNSEKKPRRAPFLPSQKVIRAVGGLFPSRAFCLATFKGTSGSFRIRKTRGIFRCIMHHNITNSGGVAYKLTSMIFKSSCFVFFQPTHPRTLDYSFAVIGEIQMFHGSHALGSALVFTVKLMSATARD